MNLLPYMEFISTHRVRDETELVGVRMDKEIEMSFKEMNPVYKCRILYIFLC